MKSPRPFVTGHAVTVPRARTTASRPLPSARSCIDRSWRNVCFSLIARCSVLGVAAVLVASCSGQQGGTAERLTYEANRAFNEGDLQAALEGYQRAVAERPDLTALDYNIGNVFHRLGRYDRAITESRKAAAGADDDVRFRAYYAIGNSYARQSKWREAYESYRNALVLNPADADTKWNLEVALLRLTAQQQAEEQARAQQQQGGDQNQGGQQQGGQQGGQQQPGQQQPGQQGGQQQGGQQQGGQQQPGGQQQGGQQQGGQQQPGQGQAQAGGQPGGNQPGGPGGSVPTQQELRDAIARFERSASIEDALRVLDMLAEQQRARQSQIPIAPPGSGVRDQ